MNSAKPTNLWIEHFDLDAIHAQVRSWFTHDYLREVLGIGHSEIESIGFEWLERAGKRWRPFLVVCMYTAFRGDALSPVPEEIRRVAVAVECIHKASLIYDDIQDADTQRYGQPTLHHVHGVPVALTASLYLLGQGYRLIAVCGAPPAQTTEMLSLATRGHCELCLGQGSELLWMRSPTPLSSQQVLDIFRWKTAPSFEVVFLLPGIQAGIDAGVREVLRNFSQIIGTAYQIQDDLADFDGREDVDDVKSGRPSIVMALTHELAQGADRDRIARAWCRADGTADLADVRRLIADTGALDKTREMLAQYKRTALDALRPLQSFELKVLLCRITDKILP